MMDQARSLLSDRAVQAYFLVLGIAIRRCVKRYYNPASATTTSAKDAHQHLSKSQEASILPIILSVAIIGITWFLILRFILSNLHTSESYFDDAYKDVLRNDHYFTSTQLLTWAIVAVVWTADSGCDLAFLLFGFLGAMGASFVLWVPSLYRQTSLKGSHSTNRVGNGNGGRRSVPIGYVLSSVVAFVSILKLRPCNSSTDECTPDQGFGSFHLHFRQWLQVLHIILVMPVFVSRIIPNMPCIDSSILFGLLAVFMSAWHVLQMVDGAVYTVPTTDCQISIATDLVCCSLVTLFAIYNDSLRTRDGTDHTSAALLQLSVAAIAIPLLSPAAVLASHLSLQRLHDSYASFVSYTQRKVASKLREEDKNASDADRAANWCNLGLWTETKDGNLCSYNEACENLAQALGKAAGLASSDAVLSCGCGSLDEVRYFKKKFSLGHITGIDPLLSEGRTADPDDFNVRVIRASVDDLSCVDGKKSLFPPRYFDKIVALDNIYHYPCKSSFLWDCFLLLPAGGKVAVSDIVLKEGSRNAPLLVKWILRMMGIPTRNLWSSSDYRTRLAAFGFGEVNVQILGHDVFKGWSRLLPKSLLKHIDYAIIVASTPIQNKPPPKKKVAIIGSGLAGLSAAHYILSSPEAAINISVDVYEANDCPGLAGNTTLIGEQLVDVPARMAALGYYNRYREILDELDIPTTIVRTDSSFYGKDGKGGNVIHCYSSNSLANVYNAVFVGGLKRLWQVIRALSRLCDDHGSIQTDSVPLTFGEWLQKHLSVSPATTFTCKDTGVDKKHDLPSLTCYENPFAYIMVGSLSWMLSCTWEQLSQYPADIVLPYCRGLNMSRLGMGRKGQVIRVTPSIMVLERALLYGVNKLQCGSRIAAVDGKKIINGLQYDAVICATETRAVPKVIKNCSDVFGKITYHPSTIYLHKDESFMPPNKKDWKCWNVEMSSGRQEPQLTIWLNVFYPDSNFDANVFQTWAPTHTPKPELTIRRSDFERVVHTQDAANYVSEIEKEQGKDGIYYAGSYCIYGMGLLEQALISGKNASDQVLHDLCCCTNGHG